jgi:Tfp pilus assembly protein PilF
MITGSDRTATRWILMALLVLCLAGCQQWSSMLRPSSKVALARKSASDTSDSSEVTKEQKADVQIAMAHSLERQGQVEQAIKAYQDALVQDKNRTDVYHRLAVIYDKKGDRENAQKYYAKALQKRPKDAELLADFGYSCYLHRRWDDAERSLRHAIELDPQLTRAHNNLGLLLAHNGHPKEALPEFAKAGCSEAEAHANLGFALSLNDDWKQARREFELAWKLDPQSRSARRGMEILQAYDSPPDTNPPASAGEGKKAPVRQVAFYNTTLPPSTEATPETLTPPQPAQPLIDVPQLQSIPASSGMARRPSQTLSVRVPSGPTAQSALDAGPSAQESAEPYSTTVRIVPAGASRAN